MSIQISSTAVCAIRAALQERGHGLGIRLEVSVSGATGLGYRLEFADEALPNDLRYQQEGVELVSDQRNAPYLQGLILDYGPQGKEEGFFVHHAENCGGCGCGEDTCD